MISFHIRVHGEHDVALEISLTALDPPDGLVMSLENVKTAETPFEDTGEYTPMSRKPSDEQLDGKVRELEKALRERNRAEKAFRRQQEQYQSWIENLPIGLYRTTSGPQGRFILANPAMARIVGLDSEEEFLRIPVSHFYADPSERKAFSEKLLSHGKVVAEALRLKKKDGTFFWGSVSAKVVRDASGRVRFFDGFVEDVTDRKRMEEELEPYRNHLESLVEERTAELKKTNRRLEREITERKRAEKSLVESEERFRSLFEGSLDAVFVADPETGKILDVNPAAEQLLLLSRERIVGVHHAELFPPRLREDARQGFSEAVLDKEENRSVETLVLRSDGTEIPVEILAQIIQIDGVPVFYGMFRDVTKRKLAEERFKESEERYRNLVELSPDGIAIESEGRIAFINTAGAAILGAESPEQLLERPVLDFVHPDNQEGVIQRMVQAKTTWRRQPLNEEKFVRLDGTVADVEVAASPVIYHGKPATQVFVREITRRKRAETALRESEEMHRTLVRTSPDAITVTDLRGNILEASQQALELHGFQSSDEFIGRNAFEFFAPRDLQKAQGDLQKTLEEGSVRNMEFTLLRRDGSSFVGEMNAALIRDAQGRPKCFISATRDITERRKWEAELSRMQTLEALGILAGGIAHDFNNILTGIMTNISLARMFGELAEEPSQMLADAEKASLRAKGLTQQLLSFATGGEPIKRTLAISRLIQDTANFALSGSNVRAECGIPADLWRVDVDEGQFAQVIQNLVINAAQAMPSGGRIRILAANTELGRGERATLNKGRYVKISVADQGHGIPEAHLPKIFDPFFTTKERGRGLGLATSFSIVKRHGGQIHVDSEVGVGTTAHVYLPATKGKLSVEPRAEDRAIQREGKILLIDDEEIVRVSARRTLERFGYEVEVATDGTNGIQLYEAAMHGGRPFDVVILDLTIPGGMGGKEAMGRLTEIDPGAKVIVSSGYSDDPAMSRHREYGFSGVLTKPYVAEDLAEAIHQVLKGIEE